MKKQQWLIPLLQIGNKKMFRKKSNGKGMLFATIISMVVSAIALFKLKRDEKITPTNSKGELKQNRGKVDIQNFLSINDRAVLAEFANELAPETNLFEERKDQEQL